MHPHINQPRNISRDRKEQGLDALPQPPHSIDLQPSDLRLNNTLRGRRFESRHAVGSADFQCMNSIHLAKEQYKLPFSDKVRTGARGEYFEGHHLSFYSGDCWFG